MSLEAIQAFRSAVATEPALQQVCASGNVQAVVDAAAARGYAFSAGELATALRDAELSDSELEMVAGGSSDGGKKDTTLT
ncbi:Nif11-like leader peptide family natural product precursor [Ramlibacter terrae]|uniref:Nif11-like leader peptide family natural product n=1 Tax=Ramlibacter terrae TaxID=2732511 RepID=A0ABX6P126_9BURK|nr:Nif11-like leader peptide family natural product precursor [Ramlibacter terrae]